MSYGLLSLPDSDDLENRLRYQAGPKNVLTNAVSKAQRHELRLGSDFVTSQPQTVSQLDSGLNQVRQQRFVLIDAHGRSGTVTDRSDPNHSVVYGPAKDTQEHPYDPAFLDLRDSRIELLVLGICDQRPASWKKAVPPGCLVIGYQKTLRGAQSWPMVENFFRITELSDQLTDHPSASDDGERAVSPSDWVARHAHGNTLRTLDDEWFTVRGIP